MINVAICDDEELHLKHEIKLISARLAQHEHICDGFLSAEALLKAMQYGDYKPDIAVLDISMGGMDGISLAKELNSLAPECQIIFLTSHLGYAPDVYSTDHCYFVIKEQADGRIGDALDKALLALSAEKRQVISVVAKSGGATEVIPVSRILCFDCYGRRTRIVTENGEFITAQKPEALLGAESGGFFVRCHQSYWVNLEKVAALKSNEFQLKNGMAVPLGRAYRRQAREAFFAYLRK